MKIKSKCDRGSVILDLETPDKTIREALKKNILPYGLITDCNFSHSCNKLSGNNGCLVGQHLIDGQFVFPNTCRNCKEATLFLIYKQKVFCSKFDEHINAFNRYACFTE